MGISQDNKCVLRDNATETRDHLFFNYSFSNEIREEIQYSNSFNNDSTIWEYIILDAATHFKRKALADKLKRTSFIAAIYYIWMERNKRIFKNNKSNHVGIMDEITFFVKYKSYNWKKSRMNFKTGSVA